MKGSIRVTIRDLSGYYNIGAFIIRVAFWGPFYYVCNKEPPKNSVGFWAKTAKSFLGWTLGFRVSAVRLGFQQYRFILFRAKSFGFKL